MAGPSPWAGTELEGRLRPGPERRSVISSISGACVMLGRAASQDTSAAAGARRPCRRRLGLTIPGNAAAAAPTGTLISC